MPNALSIWRLGGLRSRVFNKKRPRRKPAGLKLALKLLDQGRARNQTTDFTAFIMPAASMPYLAINSSGLPEWGSSLMATL
ncbi:MAG: hypothetical protein JWR26_1781 [Pedosphaera sp.]|nr:hypothetical protein [Pedosphaera sp.]